MKLTLSDDNPYKQVRKAKFNGAKAYLVEKLLINKSNLHLDFGAHDGELLTSLKAHNAIEKGIGLDANSDVVKQNRETMPDGVELEFLAPNVTIPFDRSTFSSVSIVGVVEHVVDQERLLKDLHRVLVPGGMIMIAVPGKHLFSFLDMGNWKFVFPRLHEWYICRTKGKEYFKIHYSENPDGLYGDVEREKFWHEHFSKKDLIQLTQTCGFLVEEVDGFGFFNRVLTNTAYFLPKFMTRFFAWLIELDARYFDSTEIWILARKDAT
jgi:ubiquinone/menaquinone biosynthesis C-methylase UbiE